MSQSINKFIPKRKEREQITVRVDKGLHDEVEKLLEQEGSTWVAFVEQALSNCIEASKGSRREQK